MKNPLFPVVVALGLLVVIAGNVARYNYIKLQAAKAEVVMAQEDAQRIVKLSASIGFSSGCITAVDQIRKFESGDPMITLFNDWCVQNAKAFAKTVEMK